MRNTIKIPTATRPPAQSRRLFARAPGAGFGVRAIGNTTTLEIYDEIGTYGISAKGFNDSLKAATGDLVVKINSPGGDVFDGIAIHNDLAAYRGKVTVQVTGIAASAASIIAMAGDEIEIAQGAFVMIHNCWGLTIGNQHDHAETGALLAQIDQVLAETYARRTDLDIAVIAAMMDNETWINGADAVANGFADKQISATDAKARFDLSVYAKAPAGIGQRVDAVPAQLQSHVDLEKMLRAAGLTRRQARAVSIGGYDALSGADQNNPTAISSLAERVAAATAELKRIA